MEKNKKQTKTFSTYYNKSKQIFDIIIKAGLHLGHYEQHSKIKPYIYGRRNNRYIFDLKLTYKLLQQSKIIIDEIYNNKGTILFVCTRPILAQIIQPLVPKNDRIIFINQKWIGGTLTNWDEIINYVFLHIKSVPTLSSEKGLTEKRTQEINSGVPQKSKRFSKLFNPFFTHFFLKYKIATANFQKSESPKNQIPFRPEQPSLVVLFHGNDIQLPIKEALKTRTPLISIVDSNTDPSIVTQPIPGNDDNLRAQYLQARTFFYGIPSIKNLKVESLLKNLF